MVQLFRLLMLLFAWETVPDASEEDEEDEEEEPEDSDDEPEPVRDPLKKLHVEEEKSRRLFHKLKRHEKEMEGLRAALAEHEGDGTSDALRASRMEAAFLRVVITRNEPLDLEAAWDLAKARGFLDTISITDDGDVEGMDDCLGKVLERYPWLVDEGPLPDEPDASLPRRTASPPKKRHSPAAANTQDLKERFPALARHGR